MQLQLLLRLTRVLVPITQDAMMDIAQDTDGDHYSKGLKSISKMLQHLNAQVCPNINSHGQKVLGLLSACNVTLTTNVHAAACRI